MRTMARSDAIDWRDPAPTSILLLVLLAAALGCASIASGAPAWRVLVLLLLAPAAEEVVFRVGLHEALLRRAFNPVMVNAAVAVAFAAAHLVTRPWPLAIGVIVPSLVVGLTYQRTRRVGPCIALHAAMNALWMGWELVS